MKSRRIGEGQHVFRGRWKPLNPEMEDQPAAGQVSEAGVKGENEGALLADLAAVLKSGWLFGGNNMHLRVRMSTLDTRM